MDIWKEIIFKKKYKELLKLNNKEANNPVNFTAKFTVEHRDNGILFST